MFLMSVLDLGCQLHLLVAPAASPSGDVPQPLPEPTPLDEPVGGRPLRRLIGGGPSFSSLGGRLPRWDIVTPR